MLLAFNSWRDGPGTLIYAPMMAPKCHRRMATPKLVEVCKRSSELPVRVPVTVAETTTPSAKPVPLCWCPLSAPGKLSFRDASDRLNPGRAFYQCGNRPSCSFFAWRETNEEYKRVREAVPIPIVSEPVHPTTEARIHATPTKKKAKDTSHKHKKKKIETPEDIRDESSSPDQQHRPYPCSTPIAIPPRSYTPFR